LTTTKHCINCPRYFMFNHPILPTYKFGW